MMKHHLPKNPKVAIHGVAILSCLAINRMMFIGYIIALAIHFLMKHARIGEP